MSGIFQPLTIARVGEEVSDVSSMILILCASKLNILQNVNKFSKRQDLGFAYRAQENSLSEIFILWSAIIQFLLVGV